MARWGLDGDALRAAQPGARLLLGDRVRHRRGGRGLPGYDFLLQAMGGLMRVTGEPDGRPLKVGAAVVDLVCGLLAAIGIQAALVERAAPARPPRRGLADGRRADLAAQPGLGVGRRRRRAGRGAATATRASSPTRPSRPPTGRSRSRSATTACSRGCARRRARPSSPPTSASRPTRRASRTSTSSPPRCEARSARPSPPTTGSSACARPPCRSARSTASTRRSRSPTSWAWSPPRQPTACR